MELDFFLVTVIGGLLIYFYIQKRNDSKYFECNYYYKRFLRNKLQAEKNIKELDIIIKLCNKDELILTKNGASSPEEYQFQLKHDYQFDYCNKILKKIKNHCYPKVLLNPQITFVIVYKQVDLEKLC